MAQQSSRLHRLLTLLDTGSTQSTRLAAARQIGDIAKSHPSELISLLKKVSQYLRSKTWDTRVAAAQAVGAIAENVKHITVKELISRVEAEALLAGFSENANELKTALEDIFPSNSVGLSFGSFDVNRVLEFGSPLLASGGQEYDIIVDSGKNPVERLVRQKQNLHRRLGLDVCEQFMDIGDMIKDEDLIMQKGFPHGNGVYRASASGQNIQQLVVNMVPKFRPNRLSTRELNLLKRKAKINAKDHVKGWSEDDELDGSLSRNSSKSGSAEFISKKVTMDDSIDEDSCEHNTNGGWPFYQFVEMLIHDVFDPIWEIRHGATMALREILTRQAGCAGVQFSNLSSETSLFGVDMDSRVQRKRSREFNINEQSNLMHESFFKRIKVEGQTIMSEGNIESSAVEVKPVEQLNMVNQPSDGATVTLIPNQVGVALSTMESDLIISKEEIFDHNPSVKLEPDSDIQPSDSLCYNDIGAKMPLPENGESVSMSESHSTLPENCKLRKLFESARHSSIKNWLFLQDCAIRFLCILALDRFGDFISDQVVAPVRETCAQALGAVLKCMHPSLVRETLGILLQMQSRQEWEVRHGSLLGVKYLVAVRQDMLQDLLVYVLPSCKAGLEDSDDDVRAVAAEALIPAAAALLSLNSEALHSVIVLLWDILLDLDDLSPSTSSVMNLLAEIYSQPDLVPKMLASAVQCEKELNLNELSSNVAVGERAKHDQSPHILMNLTPRLWPFMRHNITSVRHSAVRTLERLLEVCLGRSFCSEAGLLWSTPVLVDSLRIVFQNLLLESEDEILQCSLRVWRLLVQCPKQDLEEAARSYFSSWLDLASTPSGSVLDASKMFFPAALPRKSHFKAVAKIRAAKLENDSLGGSSVDCMKANLLQESKDDFSISYRNVVVGMDSEKSVIRMRVVTSAALGILASRLSSQSLQIVLEPLGLNLSSLSGFRRQVVALVLVSWFKELRDGGCVEENAKHAIMASPTRQLLLELLSCPNPAFPTKDSILPYAELSRTFKKMRTEASRFLHVIESSGLFPDFLANVNGDLETLGVDNAIELVSKLPAASELSHGNMDESQHFLDDIESAKQQLCSTAGYLNCLQANLHLAVTALIAAAVIWMSELPSKLNPIILPVMASIRRERDEILQEKAAEALAELVLNCVGRKPSPNDKLVKNILSLTCMDHSMTPQISVVASVGVIDEHDLLSLGVLSSNKKIRGQISSTSEDRSRLEGFISRRGSEFALMHLSKKFGSSLFDKLPKLWECLTDVVKPVCPDTRTSDSQREMTLMLESHKDLQILINNIQAVQCISAVIDENLKPRMLSLLPCIICCVCHHHVAVRLAASRCVASMAMSMTTSVMAAVIENVIPVLRDSGSVHARQGAGMLLSLLVQVLGVDLVPYAALLVVPLLRCMGDSDRTVREIVTHSFAALVPLLSLARGVSPPKELGKQLSRNTEDVQFLEQLLDNSHIDDYKLPITLKVEIRRYQQEGINWLSFLKRFKLHGILCDDMGLGKTLQASAIVACDIVERRCDNKNLPSLIICPSTLVGHWAYEIDKYIDESVMVTLQYVGSVQERMFLRKNFEKHNVIITSYDVVRKDIDFLHNLLWNYCILDEGHIIKNPKSKVSGAVKKIKAEHRLILSGTPIQNNVLELWSLFDFLMPGFLGTERQFQAAYGKPLLAAKDSKCSAKDAEAGVLAMEALHKQVMPFLLRRTKDEVLSDLPEKIIQDRYCDLSPVQLKLYEQFSGSNAKKEISNLVEVDHSGAAEVSSQTTTSHVFQALQYLLKVCSHPLLVLGERPPDSLLSIVAEILPQSDIMRELHEIQHSPKLVALQEILEECGIGQEGSGSEGTVPVGQHRVLIFAQHRAFLDIVERDLLQSHLKSVTYLRLDGSVDPEKRFDIVKAFNSDPTIDVLLLTTHVGGLGLNLTSADTLVFLEHDWNPMKDLQAMDRAHRLGQRNVVNVHRLIMRGTLEEKVMSLQKFKLSIANSIINADNASMRTMNTDQLLDLFTPVPSTSKGALAASNAGAEASAEEEAVSTGGKKGLKAVLSGLGELWDQSQYTEEYNLSQFLAKLNG